jgi:hypothetical protein
LCIFAILASSIFVSKADSKQSCNKNNGKRAKTIMKGLESASGHTGSINDDVFKSPARKKRGQAQGLRRSERIQHTTEDQDMQSSAVQQQGTELGFYNNNTKTTNRRNQQSRPKELSSKQVVQGHLNLAQQPQLGKILMPTLAAAANNTNIINPSSTTTTTTTATSSTTSLWQLQLPVYPLNHQQSQ